MKKAIQLDVPSYKQHYDFTCGPASLMMAMKYFDKDIDLSEDLEIDIWREASMIESYGTSRYGLAFAAARRGFKVRVYSNIDGYGFLNKLEPPIEGLNQTMLKLFFEERRKRCEKLGVRNERCAITSALIARSLEAGSIPLLLTSTKHFSSEEENEELPHWIVVTGIDNRMVYVNNPLGRKASKRTGVKLDSFPVVCGFKGDQCFVAIQGQ